LDAGLRPVEVGRAKTTWVDTENEVLRIPQEESSKNRENWVVSLTGRTASALERWMEERERYDRYDGMDSLLNNLTEELTRVAGLSSLNYIGNDNNICFRLLFR